MGSYEKSKQSQTMVFFAKTVTDANELELDLPLLYLTPTMEA
jgi:hypothetical protein